MPNPGPAAGERTIPDAANVIELEGVTKRFGTRVAVDGLSLSARTGEIYGFLGPNGAGKTTTIRMLLGILPPNAGSVRVCGHAVRPGGWRARHLVGAVAEVQYFYGEMTCREYLAFFAALYQISAPGQRVERVLEEVGLAGRSHDLAVELSKGLQQKLGLARALLHDPPVLILDEPVSGLDPHGIREVREILLRERERGRVIFLSSHVLSEVERTADRIGILYQGRIVVEDTVGALAARHGSLEQAFVSVTGSVAPVREAAP